MTFITETGTRTRWKSASSLVRAEGQQSFKAEELSGFEPAVAGVRG